MSHLCANQNDKYGTFCTASVYPSVDLCTCLYVFPVVTIFRIHAFSGSNILLHRRMDGRRAMTKAHSSFRLRCAKTCIKLYFCCYVAVWRPLPPISKIELPRCIRNSNSKDLTSPEGLVLALEHMLLPTGRESGLRRSKRPLSAYQTLTFVKRSSSVPRSSLVSNARISVYMIDGGSHSISSFPENQVTFWKEGLLLAWHSWVICRL